MLLYASGLHSGRHFVIKNRCKFWYNVWYDFWSIFDWFLDAFWIKICRFLDNFLETAISWKWAPLLWKINIFKVRRLRKSIKNRFETVSKITLIFGSNFDGFWTDFGGFSASKIDQNRYQFRDRFLEGLKMARHGLIRQSGAPGPPTMDT